MRVIICEDSALLRAGLVRLLNEAGHDVLADVGDAEELQRTVGKDLPDLVLVDVRLPPSQTTEGLQAALQIRQRHPEIAVLVLSQYVEERYAVDLITQGAQGVGYLLKERIGAVREFTEALAQVGAGGTVIDPEVVAQLLGRRRQGNRVDSLSPRELEVLRHMAEGRSNRGIAEDLVLTRGAVEKHISSIFDKLSLTDVASDNRRVRAVLTYLGGPRP